MPDAGLTGPVVLMTDHSSAEGDRDVLATAVVMLTGRPPVHVDARDFMTGGGGRVGANDGRLRLAVPARGIEVAPAVLLIYEIPPAARPGFASFQRLAHRYRPACLGTDADAWWAATDKIRTVERFAADGIPHMQTISLSRPGRQQAADAFARLGRDVWARPSVGMRGDDVFHITSGGQLHRATDHYAATGQDWQIARDAGNIGPHGLRHQFRVEVLNGHILRACEHVQADPDAPCNVAKGAVCTMLAAGELPAPLGELAILATKSVGLPFGGVDLAAENGGAVFEVNVHPTFAKAGGLEAVAVPYVQAHLDMC